MKKASVTALDDAWDCEEEEGEVLERRTHRSDVMRKASRPTDPPSSTAIALAELERIARAYRAPRDAEADRTPTERPPRHVDALGAISSDEVVADLKNDARVDSDRKKTVKRGQR